MGVMRAALSDMKGGECSASYALVTHPGHHASIRYRVTLLIIKIKRIRYRGTSRSGAGVPRS
jgi:hypothetical protein